MRRWAILAAVGTLAVLPTSAGAQFVTPPLIPAQTTTESIRPSARFACDAPRQSLAEDAPRWWISRVLKKMFARRGGGKAEVRAQITWADADNLPPMEAFAELRSTSVPIRDKSPADDSLDALRRWAERVGARTPADAPSELPATPLADEGTIAPPRPAPLTYIGTVPAAEPAVTLPLPR
jgi:hypothetical protein